MGLGGTRRGRGARRSWVVRAALAALTLTVVATGASATGDERPFGETEVLTTTPSQDHPEGVALNGNTLFVSTTVGVDGPAVGSGRQSRIYAFDRRTGELRHTITVEGEDVMQFRGIAGLTLDAADRLYAADVQGRILRFTRARDGFTQETYAVIPDLAPCLPGVARPCSPTLDDRPPLPNDLVFDEDGTLYVTDSWQATIFTIPPREDAQVWFQDALLDGPVGVNGIEISPDGRHVFFTVTGDFGDKASVFRLPRSTTPARGDLRRIASWSSGGADGLAFGESGKLYVTLYAQNRIAVLDHEGSEVAEVRNPVFDEPATMVFDDTRASVLLANHAFVNPRPDPRTVVRVYVAEAGAPPARPRLP